MKIYHTETQSDFGALMEELEAEGVKFYDKEKLESSEIPSYFGVYKYRTCIMVDGTTALYNPKDYYEMLFPDIQIIKYKAKADEKMKFTKENIYNMVERYRSDFDYLIGDLKSDIFNLDDTPEKVVVPKCFDEWYSEIKNRFRYKESGKKYALWKINQFGFGYWLQDVNGENIDKEAEVSKWVSSNTMIAIDAVLNGYTIEPEQLYYIPLPHLETSDGIQQVLSKRDTYFASRPNDNIKQRFTKAELERVPEIYKFYAKLIEEEE